MLDETKEYELPILQTEIKSRRSFLVKHTIVMSGMSALLAIYFLKDEWEKTKIPILALYGITRLQVMTDEKVFFLDLTREKTRKTFSNIFLLLDSILLVSFISVKHRKFFMRIFGTIINVGGTPSLLKLIRVKPKR
jgi:hypothetical protein